MNYFENLRPDTCSRISVAAMEGNSELLRTYLSQGNIRAVDNRGWTALHHAVLGGNLECIKILLDCGAEVNALSHERETALTLICKMYIGEKVHEKQCKIAALLFAAGCDPNVPHGDIFKSTFSYAIESKNFTLIKLFVNRNVNINGRDFSHHSPLHAAAEYGLLDILKYIISLNPEVSLCPEMNSPLHILVVYYLFYCLRSEENKAQRLECLRALLKYHPCVSLINQKNIRDSTCLGMALYSGWMEGSQLLYDYGADVAFEGYDQEDQLEIIHKYAFKMASEKDISKDGLFIKLLSAIDLRLRDGTFFQTLDDRKIYYCIDNSVVHVALSFRQKEALKLILSHGVHPDSYNLPMIFDEQEFILSFQIADLDIYSVKNNRLGIAFNSIRHYYTQIVRPSLEIGVCISAVSYAIALVPKYGRDSIELLDILLDSGASPVNYVGLCPFTITLLSLSHVETDIDLNINYALNVFKLLIKHEFWWFRKYYVDDFYIPDAIQALIQPENTLSLKIFLARCFPGSIVFTLDIWERLQAYFDREPIVTSFSCIDILKWIIVVNAFVRQVPGIAISFFNRHKNEVDYEKCVNYISSLRGSPKRLEDLSRLLVRSLVYGKSHLLYQSIEDLSERFRLPEVIKSVLLMEDVQSAKFDPTQFFK